MATRTLEIKFVGDASDAKRAFAEVDDSGGKLEGRMGGLKSAFGGVATVAGGFLLGGALQSGAGFLVSAAQAAAEDAAATERLEQSLRNAGGAFDENLAKINERIAAGQALAFSDDQVRDSFQTLLAATGDVEESLNRQTVAMDLARGAGIPLEAATRMVAKVNDESVESFKRLGITIGEGATEAEALAAVQAKFAGQADAYAQSTAGQMEQAKLRMGELKEQLGAALLPALTAFATYMTGTVLPAVEKFADAAGPKIRDFVQDVKRYWESDLKPALDNLEAAWRKLEPVIVPLLKIIIDNVELMAKNVGLAIGIIVDLIEGDFSGAWEKAKEIVANAVQFVKDTLGNIGTAMSELMPILGEAAKALGQAIVDAIWAGLGDLWQLGADIPGWIAQGLSALAWKVLDAAGDLASKAKELLNPKNWVGSPKGLQNWYSYYFGIAMDNLEAEGVPRAEAAGAKLNEAFAKGGSFVLGADGKWYIDEAAMPAGVGGASTTPGQALLGSDGKWYPNEAAMPSGVTGASTTPSGYIPSYVGADQTRALATAPKVGDTFNGMTWTGTYWSQAGARMLDAGEYTGYLPPLVTVVQIDGATVAEAVNKHNGRGY